MLTDPVLRASELWSRRERIEWEDRAAPDTDSERICYFDQLAVLPEARMHSVALALAALRSAARSGHSALFATVVAEPVRNRASLPLLAAIGARRVGRLEEEYEGVGRIVSDLYHAEVRSAIDRAASLRVWPRARRALERSGLI